MVWTLEYCIFQEWMLCRRRGLVDTRVNPNKNTLWNVNANTTCHRHTDKTFVFLSVRVRSVASMYICRYVENGPIAESAHLTREQRQRWEQECCTERARLLNHNVLTTKHHG